MAKYDLKYFFGLVCETIGTAATPGLLSQPRVIVKMIVESRWNVDWQGKPKFSEKTCPGATFVHHKILPVRILNTISIRTQFNFQRLENPNSHKISFFVSRFSSS
jgi:hypothetical protein